MLIEAPFVRRSLIPALSRAMMTAPAAVHFPAAHQSAGFVAGLVPSRRSLCERCMGARRQWQPCRRAQDGENAGPTT